MRRDLILKHLSSMTEPTPSEKFQAEFLISDRTLRNELKELKEIGERVGFRIKRSREQGYFLLIDNDEEFQKYLDEIDGSDAVELKRVRASNLIVLLLQSANFITIESLAERLMISRSTVLSDLIEVEKQVSDFSLEIERKSHYGIRLVGDEIKLRKALSFFMNQNDLCLQKKVNFEEFENNFPVEVMRATLSEGLSMNNLNISYFAFENIFAHIKVLAFRVTQGNYILEGQENRLDASKIKPCFHEISRKVCELISNIYSVEMPESEVTYLSAHICGKSSADVIEENERKEIREKLSFILTRLDQSFHTAFANDTLLLDSLCLHMYPLLNRLYFNLTLSNPLIDDLYSRYSHLFLITINFSEITKEIWGFELSKDEMGYITMHFATHMEREKQKVLHSYKKILLVSETGNASDSLAIMKLRTVFIDAEIEVISSRSLSEVNLSKYDLLISSTPMNQSELEIPCFTLSNIPTENDLQKLKRFASKYPTDKFGGFQTTISMFHPELFSIESEKDYKKILEDKANQVVHLDFATKEFPALVFERENIISTVFQDGVAAPHPLKMVAKKASISVVIFKKPIQSNGKQVQIMFLMNLCHDDKHTHKEISSLIMHLIESPQDKQKLIRVKDFEEFHFEISKILLKGVA